MNLKIYYICFQYFFLYLNSSYLLQLISVALNSHFHKLSKFVNVFVFIKGNILRSVLVVIQNDFPSMFHKSNFSHCEKTQKQYIFCPQHLILSWGKYLKYPFSRYTGTAYFFIPGFLKRGHICSSEWCLQMGF